MDIFIDIDKWREIFGTLSRHKLRTALTAFGVFWGIFMLTVLLGASKGLQTGVASGFPRVANAIWVWTKGTTQLPYAGMPVGRKIRLQRDDLDAIEKDVGSVGMIKGQNSIGIWEGEPAYTVYKSNSGSFSAQGAFAGFENIQSMRLVSGRFLNAFDEQEKRKVLLIGERVKDQLFGKQEDAIGKFVTLSGISAQVVGVFASLSRDNAQQEEEKIYMPNDTLRDAFNQRGWVGNFVIVPKPGVDASVAEADVIRYLNQRKKIDPNDKGIFGTFNLQVERDKVQGLFTGIDTFSWIVAIGTIMAGAIGVGNIMLIVVKERTREIGLRKALGATPTSIIMMIMQESLFISIVAGYSGLVVGTFLLEGLNKIVGENAGLFKHPQADFKTAIAALMVLVIAGVLASLLPASKAAAVNPITALQDE